MRSIPSSARVRVYVIHVQFEGSGLEPVTIRCPPPFAELLWHQSAKEPFDALLTNLRRTHCEFNLNAWYPSSTFGVNCILAQGPASSPVTMYQFQAELKQFLLPSIVT
jgi:hypothetical protein